MSIFEKVKKELSTKGYPLKSVEARNWLRKRFKDAHMNPAKILEEKRKKPRINMELLGRMFFYYYDPKLKDVLPFYDRFPLVIPIELYDDGFLGLNLHYLDMQLRIGLLDRLTHFQNNDRLDESTKIKMRYQLLASTKRLNNLARPCIKRYLYNHIESRMVEIDPINWELACYLPVEQFKGASRTAIHKATRRGRY